MYFALVITSEFEQYLGVWDKIPALKVFVYIYIVSSDTNIEWQCAHRTQKKSVVLF